MAFSLRSLTIARVPTSPFLQSSFAECGLACVGMIAACHGMVISMHELRSRFQVSLHGLTAKRIIDIAENLNLSGRALRLELDELRGLRLPAILHWDLSHFVVLLAVGAKEVRIFDPAVGERKTELKEVGRHFSGVAMELWPNHAFAECNRLELLTIKTVIGSISGLTAPLVGSISLAALISIAGLLAPLQIQLLVDQAIVRADDNLAFLIVLGFACLAVFSLIGRFLRGYLLLRLSQSLSISLRGNLVRRMLSLPLSFFQSRHIGDLLNKLQSATEVRNFLMSGALGLIVDGFFASIALVLLGTYGLNLMLLCLVSIAAVQAVDLMAIPHRRSILREETLALGRENTALVEMLRGILTIKLSGRGAQRVAVWESLYSHYLSRRSCLVGLNLVVEAIQGAMDIAISAILSLVLVNAVVAERMSIGMMMSFLAYRSFFSGSLQSLINTIVDFRLLAVPLSQLADIYLSDAESTAGQKLCSGLGKIEFRDVWFRYDSSMPFVLQGASFTISAGESVAISGASGSGKSTIFNLLLRSLKPDRGEIFLDGLPIESISLQDYREKLGVVVQDDQLFSGTLLENITLFDESADRTRLEWACQMACLNEDLSNMPMGLMSLVGDMGSALSGGQKQKVILARALYRKPLILLADEATSHLDPESEMAIVKNLVQLNCTRLSIAHRQETLRMASRVLHLKNGVLTERAVDS